MQDCGISIADTLENLQCCIEPLILKQHLVFCLCSQGVDTMETRQVSTRVPLTEIPFVMRAMGFYPSEQEVSDGLDLTHKQLHV